MTTTSTTTTTTTTTATAMATTNACPVGRQGEHYRIILYDHVEDMGVVPEVARVRTRSGNHVAVGIYRHGPRGDASTSARPKVLLYSHGNAVDLGSLHSVAALLAQECGCTVVTYDYSGYGESTGSPSELETYRDIDAVYEYVKSTGLVDDPARDLVLVGESIGSGPAIWLSSRRAVAGVILQAAIASGLRVLTENRLLCGCDIFPNIDRIARVTCPVFVIHGTEDRNVRLDHGQRLHARLHGAAARYPPWWVEGAGHNNIQESRTEDYLRRVREFLTFLDGDATVAGGNVGSGGGGGGGGGGAGSGDAPDGAVGEAKGIRVSTLGGGGGGGRSAATVHPVVGVGA
jgi:pimeloyl-ACP methyl ester carboxylesterase